MINSKIQVVPVSLGIGTTAGKRSYDVTFESGFSICKGFYVIRNTGTDYLKIGIVNASGSPVLEPCNIKHLIVGESVEIAKRFFVETPFEANGKTAKVTIENFGTTTALQDTDVLFLLENTADK